MAQASALAAWVYVPAAISFLLGAALFLWAMLADRAGGRARCPRCWYDLTGAPPAPTRCPECGALCPTDAHLRRTRRRWLPAALALPLLAPLLLTFLARDARNVYYALMPTWKSTATLSHGPTTITLATIRDPRERGHRITVSSPTLNLDVEDFHASLSAAGPDHPPLFDADSDGTPEIALEFFSGGAHCCYRVVILTLTPAGAHLIADIDAQNGMAIAPPLPASTHHRFIIPEQSFCYWRASYAESPKPTVVYRLHQGALRIDLNAMRKPPLSPDAITALANSLANRAKPDPAGTGLQSPALIWAAMLDALYAGHDEQAWLIFDRASPGIITDTAEFKADFLKTLAASPQWADFRAALAAEALNQPIPPASIAAPKPTEPTNPAPSPDRATPPTGKG